MPRSPTGVPLTHKGASGASPSGCCNGAPCRAPQALLLIGCGASRASRDLKPGAPRRRGSGSASLAGRRASWESRGFQCGTQRSASRQSRDPQRGSCRKGSWDSRFPQGGAPWCRVAQQLLLTGHRASWESRDCEYSAPCGVSRELLLIGQRALWESCDLQHGSRHKGSWEPGWGEDAPWCRGLQKCLLIGQGPSGGSRDPQGTAPCRAPWGAAEPSRALPAEGVSSAGSSPRHRLKRHWTRGSWRLELEGAEPNRGFALSGPRGRGLSRAWLEGEERVGGGARTPEMLTLHRPPRGWWSRTAFQGLRGRTYGQNGGVRGITWDRVG